MSELQAIHAALERAVRRRRWARALRGLWQGLLAGAVVALLLVAAYRVYPLPLWTLSLAAWVALPFAALGLAWGGWRKPGLAETARWVDLRQRLQERLSTALEVSSEPRAGAWRDLVMSDAARHAKDLDPRGLLPFHLPNASRWALVVLALAAGLGFVPEYRSKSYLQKQTDQQHIQDTGRQLAELTRRNLEKRPPALEPTEKALEAVASLGEDMAKQTLTRSDALKELANVAEKVRDQIRDLERDPALKRMEAAARNPSGPDSQSASGLQKQMEALQKQLGTPTGNPDAMDRLRKDLEKMQQAAKALADKNSPDADAQRQKLSESLSALSRQVQGMGLQLPQLEEAIEALAQNQTDLVLKDLEEATTDLEKMREMARHLQQLQQQLEKRGKDLAEQLKNGQPEAAQQTLQNMISQLNSPNLTPEQLQKIMEEVAKAESPAGNYGKVADHLREASGQLKAGDTAGGGQSLASAARELDKLMQQMGDAQDLQATLQNLNEASTCIASGQGWRACNGPPKAGQTGKPGRGVGTWADEDATWDGLSSAGWDNSGVLRPDADARGQTDRGEGELSEALKPTKVTGKFSPGDQMPSITLKGVSIKGQSKVDFEQAATAAQSDAESALSQEKVPRAYQGAVKDYFDDLKK